MPIYAYKCGSCGHAKDVLQKISDAPLTDCPACGAAAFSKQITAAGFQLKGSGWYATDFRNGSTPAAAPAADGSKSADGAKPADTAAKPADTVSKPAESSGSSAKSDAPTASAGSSGSDRAGH
ncbi:MAG TPA: FmdB family zinc ribbon protein [Ramlibacter sp.]|nr:FmdB family zinc ribbon protein [Ramlibacter sp.]